MSQTMNVQDENQSDMANHPQGEQAGLLELLSVLVEHRWRLLAVPLAIGSLALGVAFLIKPTYSAKTLFLPPQQQQQSSAASALASLGSLAGLVGGAGGLRTPGDQYVALLQSTKVADQLVDRFKLMDVYDVRYRSDARRKLANNVRITLGKKDGLIAIEADANEPALAADLANEYVVSLRKLISTLQLTEAQRRRAFYQTELERTSKDLAQAQAALQGSGFNAGALKAEPKAAAEAYARLRASLTEGEVKLQGMRRMLADTAPEVERQLALLAGLREQLNKLESQESPQGDADYISKYRSYKYQETLFELFSKQYELAKLDESQDGALVQVIDVATPPEHKSKPGRALIAVAATLLSAGAYIAFLIGRQMWAGALRNPANAAGLSRLRAAWSGKR